VWKTLLDVERIAPCMPGATVERVDGDEVAGRVRVKVGPITASYAGTARFVTKDEAAHRFVLEGSGRETRGTGTASATVEVSMSEQDADTRVRVVTTLEVTGKQAQFGRGVMADIAAKLTDQFAACLAERVRGPAPAAEPGASPQAAEPRAVSPQSVSALAAAPQDAAAGSLDLVSTVAMPVLKRLSPVLGGLAFGLVLGLLLGHRRRIVIMTAAAPGSYPPARTVL
jgi:carbon monoxide dehydrogenase subunit G